MSVEDQLFPWNEYPSIYSFIQQQLDRDGKITNDTLPDEESLHNEHGLSFAPGALDGIMSHHGGGDVEEDLYIKKLIQLLRNQVENPTHKTRRATYIEIVDRDVLPYIDSFLEEIRIQSDELNAEGIYQEAIWFIKNAAHRNVVKFGISLLGLFRCDEEKDLLMTIGRHEEFTLYTIVALQYTEDYNSSLFQLAQEVDGWGKIHIVERLEPETEEIKDWLLRKGCQNAVMNQYLAYECAEKGDLHQALLRESIDDELYVGVGVIIEGMLDDEGPVTMGMDDYEHAEAVLYNYLRHSQKLCKRVEDLYLIIQIKLFLEQDEEIWQQRYEGEWTPERRKELLSMAHTLLSQEKWEDLIWENLESPDRNLFFTVKVANELSLDVWPALFEKLKKNPVDSDLYFYVMSTTERSRIDQLIQFAQETFPLDEIATGPDVKTGFGKEYLKYQWHHCLDLVLQSLNQFEGIGVKLIQAALQSPVVSNRYKAIQVLKSWETKHWEATCSTLLINLAQHDPDEELRQEAAELVKRIHT